MRRATSLAIEGSLAGIAQQQLGLITRAQAAASGISSDSLEKRAKCKSLIRVHPGVYRTGTVPASNDQRILAGWLALSRTNVSIARFSAAAIHGLPLGPQNRSTVDLLSFSGNRVRQRGIVVQRTKVKPQTQGWNGARITTVSQTICDLAAVVDRDTLGRCVDHSVAHGIASVASIRQIVLSKHPAGFEGRAQLVAVLHDRADGRIKQRSMLEQRVGKWLNEAGLGGFVSNYRIDEAEGLEVDFAWINSYASLEISPFFTHGSEKKQHRDVQRRQLLGPTRWTVIEADDADLKSPATFARIINLLRQVMAKANAEYGKSAA